MDRICRWLFGHGCATRRGGECSADLFRVQFLKMAAYPTLLRASTARIETVPPLIEALALPAEWDAYARMNGIRAFSMSGALLSLNSMLPC